MAHGGSHAADYVLGGLGTAAGLAFAKEGYDKVGEIGEQAYGEFTGDGGLADVLSDRLKFQPYTVTTATGSDFGMMEKPETTLPDGTVVSAQTDYRLGLSPDEQAFYENRLAGAGGMFAAAEEDTATREQEVYDRMMAAMAPVRDRERLDLEELLAGQGRLGVRTGMFGGSSEQLAHAQAEEEAKNQAILYAMPFAGAEQMRQAQLGAGMLFVGYTPQADFDGALHTEKTHCVQPKPSGPPAPNA